MKETLKETFEIVYHDVIEGGCGYIDWKDRDYKNCNSFTTALKVANVFISLGYNVYAELTEDGTIGCFGVYEDTQEVGILFVKWKVVDLSRYGVL